MSYDYELDDLRERRQDGRVDDGTFIIITRSAIMVLERRCIDGLADVWIEGLGRQFFVKAFSWGYKFIFISLEVLHCYCSFWPKTSFPPSQGQGDTGRNMYSHMFSSYCLCLHIIPSCLVLLLGGCF
jgi:hypothetical protein